MRITPLRARRPDQLLATLHQITAVIALIAESPSEHDVVGKVSETIPKSSTTASGCDIHREATANA